VRLRTLLILSLVFGDLPAASKPVSLSLTWSNYVGGGTFVPGPTNNPYLLTDLAVSTSITLPWAFSLSLYEEAWVEVTQSDSTTGAMQAQMFDPQATLSFSGLSYAPWGLASSINGFALAPLSLSSRRMGSLGALGIGVRASWTIPVVATTFGFSSAMLGNGFSAPLADRYAQNEGRTYTSETGARLLPQSCIRRTPQEGSAYVCGTLPTVGTSSASLSISQSLFSGFVSFGASGSLLTFYTGYLGPSDRFTNANARPGVGAWHSSQGILWASLTPWSWLSLEVGTFSVQSAFTADGKWPRLPWWDFISPRNNFSTFYFSSTVTL